MIVTFETRRDDLERRTNALINRLDTSMLRMQELSERLIASLAELEETPRDHQP